jgi:UDP-N-acetylmuramate--alanine ligase
VGVIQRRFERKGEAGGVLLIDDYGHHPTEIVATLATLKTCYPDRRAVVLFQPHRYTRTRALLEEFTQAFNQADRLIVTEIYAAGEAPIPGVSGEALYEAIRAHGHRDVHFEPEVERLPARVAPDLAPGDVVLTLGAGSISGIGREILRLLQNESGA